MSVQSLVSTHEECTVLDNRFDARVECPGRQSESIQHAACGVRGHGWHLEDVYLALRIGYHQM